MGVPEEPPIKPEGDEKRDLVIAVVDDSESDLICVQRLVKRMRQWRVEVLSFLDPEEAAAALPPMKIDLIVTDYHMGRWTGLDLVGQLREAGQDAPVILLTGSDDTRLQTRSEEAGVASQLDKNELSVECLMNSITKALDAGPYFCDRPPRGPQD
jgi:DNA-binding NarL/FixJ family response regulator